MPGDPVGAASPQAPDLELFVSDGEGSRGPLPVGEVRREIGAGTISPRARFRAGTAGGFLPGAAWEPLSDLLPAPPPPERPAGGASPALPADVAGGDPRARERLLWFVADADGVMGPVNGEFVRKGLASGKLAPGSACCLVGSSVWVRAPAVFPEALGGSATSVRNRPLATVPCAFCLEPMALADAVCDACGERPARPVRPARSALAAACGALLVVGATIGAGAASRWGGDSIPVLSASAAQASGAPATGPASARPSEASGAGSSSALAPRDTTSAHLARAAIASTIDVPPDTTDAYALPGDRIALARRAALEVLDARSGAFVSTNAELAGTRALEPVGPVVYALGGTRVGVVEPATLRVLKWFDLRVPPSVLAAPGGAGASAAVSPAGAALALAASPIDRSVAVIDLERHAEVDRFRFDDAPLALAVAGGGEIAVGATGDPRLQRPGDDAVYVWSPARLASAQPVRRVWVGDGAVDVALAPDASYAVAVVRRTSEIVRIDLAGSGAPGAADGLVPPAARVGTCKDPVRVRVTATAVVVACRAGRAIALHAPRSLEPKGTVDVGGPVEGLAIAPDGLEALAVVRAPAQGVAAVDLRSASARRLALPDEITSARYDRTGALAIAFAARRHKLWVLR